MEDAETVNHLIKKLELLDPQHQLGHCGLWCLQHVGSCPIVCRGERGRETDCDDGDQDDFADGDREEDEDEDEDHIDDNDRDDHCFICRKKGRGDGDQESDKECPRNRRDAGCIWWSWRSPSFTAIFSISMFTGCPKKFV